MEFDLNETYRQESILTSTELKELEDVFEKNLNEFVDNGSFMINFGIGPSYHVYLMGRTIMLFLHARFNIIFLSLSQPWAVYRYFFKSGRFNPGLQDETLSRINVIDAVTPTQGTFREMIGIMPEYVELLIHSGNLVEVLKRVQRRLIRINARMASRDIEQNNFTEVTEVNESRNVIIVDDLYGPLRQYNQDTLPKFYNYLRKISGRSNGTRVVSFTVFARKDLLDKKREILAKIY